MKLNDKKIPDMYLEQFVLGELNAEKEAEIRELMEHNGEINTRVRSISESNNQFLSEKHHSSIQSDINRRVIRRLIKSEKKEFQPWQFASVGMIAILALYLVTPYSYYSPQKEIESQIYETPSDIRLKGIKPELHIYRKQNNFVEHIENKQLVKENDLLQIKYQGAGYQYGLIFSVDGRGETTLHFPEAKDQSNKIQPQGDIALPFAYQLDDAPNYERFFLITSHKKFDIDEVLTLSKKIQKNNMQNENVLLDLPEEVYQTSILLTKAK